jgi:hypothetical protein
VLFDMVGGLLGYCMDRIRVSTVWRAIRSTREVYLYPTPAERSIADEEGGYVALACIPGDDVNSSSSIVHLSRSTAYQ